MREDGSPTCSFSTPKKYKRDKPITGIDDFDKCVVRRTVHEAVSYTHLDVYKRQFLFPVLNETF